MLETMTRAPATALILAIIVLPATCLAADDAREVSHAIAAQNEKFMTVFKAGDAEGVAALYTNNALLLPPNAELVRGRENIEAFWQGAMESGVRSLALESVEVTSQGSTACEVGTFTLFGENKQPLDEGKYIVIWKRASAAWKLHRDIWNSSRPAPGE